MTKPMVQFVPTDHAKTFLVPPGALPASLLAPSPPHTRIMGGVPEPITPADIVVETHDSIRRWMRVACFRLAGARLGIAASLHAWVMSAEDVPAVRERLRILEPIASEYSRRENAADMLRRAEEALVWVVAE